MASLLTEHKVELGRFQFSPKVPAAGERLSFENLDFYVTAADARRVKQVRVTAKPDGRGEVKD